MNRLKLAHKSVAFPTQLWINQSGLKSGCVAVFVQTGVNCTLQGTTEKSVSSIYSSTLLLPGFTTFTAVQTVQVYTLWRPWLAVYQSFYLYGSSYLKSSLVEFCEHNLWSLCIITLREGFKKNYYYFHEYSSSVQIINFLKKKLDPSKLF